MSERGKRKEIRNDDHTGACLAPVSPVAGSQAGLLLACQGDWQALEQIPDVLTHIAVGPDQALFVASPEGLLRSLDGGETWHMVIEGETGNLHHFAFRTDGSGWAGSADGTRLLRTSDGGASWRALSMPFGVLSLAAL